MLSTVDTMEALARMNQGEREQRDFNDVVELKGYRIETDAQGKPVSMDTLVFSATPYLTPGAGMKPPLPHALEVRTAAGETFAVVIPTSLRLWPGEEPGSIGRMSVVAFHILDGPVRFTLDGKPWSPSAS